MKINAFFLLLVLFINKLSYSQEFVTVDNDVLELVENVNYKLYKGDSLVYNSVTLSDKPTKINKEIVYDSIVFSRIDYETLGLPKKEIEQIIFLTKKTFTIDEIVIDSKNNKDIILGEKNRFIKRSRTFDETDDVTYGIVFKNELKEKMLIDKVAFYVDKVKYKTAYKIVFYEVKETELEHNLFAEIREVEYSTDTLYLYPKQKNKIEVLLDTDVFLSDKPLFVSFQLIGHYDENENPITPDISQMTKMKFQISDKFSYYSKLSDVHTGKLSEGIININRWLHHDYYYTFFKKPHKSNLAAPAVLLYLSKLPAINIKNDTFKR